MTIEVREEEAKITYKLTEINVDDVFNINFQYGDDDENIRVSIRFQDGTSQILVLDTDYRVESSDGTNGVFGTIVILEEYSELLNLCIYRDVPLSQETKFDSQTVFADTTEQALDKLTMICQDNMFENRTIRVPKDEVLADNALLMASATERANKFFKCDQQGYLTFVDNIESAENALRQSSGEPSNPTFELKLVDRRGKVLAFNDNDDGDVEFIDRSAFTTEIIDNLNDSSTDKALSANMGKTLNDMKADKTELDTKQDKINDGTQAKINEKNEIELNQIVVPEFKSTTIKSNYTQSVVIDNVYYTADKSELAYTTDGLSWNYRNMPSVGETSWGVSGKTGFMFALEGKKLAYSNNNGEDWTLSETELPMKLRYPIITWSETEQIWLAFSGDNAHGEKAIWSSDGLNWNLCTNFFDQAFSICEKNGIWVGNTGEFMTYKCTGSPKTGTWEPVEFMSINLCSDEDGFAAFGANSEKTGFFKSIDGTQWTCVNPIDQETAKQEYYMSTSLLYHNGIYTFPLAMIKGFGYTKDLKNILYSGPETIASTMYMIYPSACGVVNDIFICPIGGDLLEAWTIQINEQNFALPKVVFSGKYSDLVQKLTFEGDNIEYNEASETVKVQKFNEIKLTIEEIKEVTSLLDGAAIDGPYAENDEYCFWKITGHKILRYDRTFKTFDIKNLPELTEEEYEYVSIASKNNIVMALTNNTLYQSSDNGESWNKVSGFTYSSEVVGAPCRSIIWTGQVWCVTCDQEYCIISNDGISWNNSSIGIHGYWRNAYKIGNRVILTDFNGEKLAYSNDLSCSSFSYEEGESSDTYPSYLTCNNNNYYKALYVSGSYIWLSLDGINYEKKHINNAVNGAQIAIYKGMYFVSDWNGWFFYSIDSTFSTYVRNTDYNSVAASGIYFFIIDDELYFSDDTTLRKVNISDIILPIDSNKQARITNDNFIEIYPATTEQLGIVQPDGTTITVDNGVISAVNGGTYTLPPATASTLGGIKVGTGLSVTEDGTLSVAGEAQFGKIFCDGSISNNTWTSITYGNGMYVSVSNSNATAWSTDGKTFTDGSISDGTWYSITYGNNMFVAINNSDGKTAWSTDGKTFTDGSISSWGWRSITYGNGMFVAVSGDGKTAWSTDGKTFTDGSISYGMWYSITYGNNMFVAVSSDGKTAWSTDGKTFTDGSISAKNWFGITYGNGMFVAVSNNGKTAWSTDGKAFNDGSISDGAWQSIAYGNNMFVAVGYYGKTAWSANVLSQSVEIKIGSGLVLSEDGTLSVDVSTLKTLLNS